MRKKRGRDHQKQKRPRPSPAGPFLGEVRLSQRAQPGGDPPEAVAVVVNAADRSLFMRCIWR
jgi:hypothetical protein